MRLARFGGLLSVLPMVASAQVADLADMSLEQLSNLRVTSVTLRAERYSDAPASVFVITNEDIRRSGAKSLPEALRLAPNLEVARVSGNTYAISARGFLNVITNKLLVLLDGRTLYTTVLSGVLWDAQDVMLEDVERIEVISGPGAALFGANAFVGVINIITRSAADTVGGVAVAGGGNLSKDVAARYGAKIGDSGALRIYGMHTDREGLRPGESGLADHTAKTVFGFRSDFRLGRDAMVLQGDTYDARITGNGAPEVRLKGSNVLGRWSRDLGGESKLSLQAYWDQTSRDDPLGFKDRVDTFDVEAQYDMPTLGRHKVSAGAGYRYASDRTLPTPVVRFIPDDRRLHWASAFAQDDITITPDLSVTLGAKVQTAIYVDPEFMPDLRISWKPAKDHLLWAGASRVARTPGRVDRELFVPGNPPFFIQGGPDFQSEEGNVFEVGYRGRTQRLSYSMTFFHHRLDQLRGGRASGAGGAFISNEVEGATTGLEAWAMWQVNERWRLTAGLLELKQDLRAKNGSGDLNGPANLGNDPRHTVKVRSSYRVTPALDFDVHWRYVSSLAYLTTVPAYQATDARIAWRVSPRVEIALQANNLFDRRHVEFDEHGLPAEIPRAAYLEVRVGF